MTKYYYDRHDTKHLLREGRKITKYIETHFEHYLSISELSVEDIQELVDNHKNIKKCMDVLLGEMQKRIKEAA